MSRATARRGPAGTPALLALAAVVLLAVGATLGLALAPRAAAPAAARTPGPVDIGFSRDMVVHHTQGVSMANMAQQHTDDHEIRVVAFDIASTQQTDIGEMNGWLDLWQVPRIGGNAVMAWMEGSDSSGMDMSGMGMPGGAGTGATTGTPGASGSAGAGAGGDGAVMPGMATTAEMRGLDGRRGPASDIYFLQLMIRHHQGGRAMMSDAAGRASLPVVRLFAQKMLAAQDREISIMTQMLSARGAVPLS